MNSFLISFYFLFIWFLDLYFLFSKYLDHVLVLLQLYFHYRDLFVFVHAFLVKFIQRDPVLLKFGIIICDSSLHVIIFYSFLIQLIFVFSLFRFKLFIYLLQLFLLLANNFLLIFYLAQTVLCGDHFLGHLIIKFIYCCSESINLHIFVFYLLFDWL
jgi:hypothetical protein